MKKTINIEGMHCSSCAALIEDALEGKVNSVKVSVMSKKAVVDFDEKKISEKLIIQDIAGLGYKVNA